MELATKFDFAPSCSQKRRTTGYHKRPLQSWYYRLNTQDTHVPPAFELWLLCIRGVPQANYPYSVVLCLCDLRFG